MRVLSRSTPGTVALVILGQAIVFVPVSLIRFLDGDEGSYALAAKLVGEGNLPYRDFVYPQMPLLPFVYAAWTALTEESWHSVRVLSALFAIAIGVLLYATVTQRFGRRLAALGVLLYTFSAPVFYWFPTLKTYVVPTFLLFAAYTVVTSESRVRPIRWFAAGVLAALAIDSRLIFAAAVPAFVLGVYQEKHDQMRHLVMLGAGLVVGLAPAWFFLVLDPSRFAYDNIGAYARQGDGLVTDFGQKVRVLENLLGIGTPGDAVPQFLLLVVASAAAVAALRTLRLRIPLSLSIAACLAVGNLAPTPSYPQYFCTAVPFLVVATVELAGALDGRLRAAGDLALRRTFTVVLAVAATIYVAIGIAELHRALRLYGDQRIASARAIAEIIDEQTTPGELVMTSWPGYLFGTDARPVQGLESDFAPLAAASLTPAEARRHLRASIADVDRMIREHQTRLLVVKMWHVADPVPEWSRIAERSGYRLLLEVPAGDTEVGGPVRVYVLDR